MAVLDGLSMLRVSTWSHWAEKNMGYEARRQGSRKPAEFSSQGKRVAQADVCLVIVD